MDCTIPSWSGGVSVLLMGLVFGSFANVVIWRFPRGESLSHPGSHCPACGAPVRWYDNIPVLSWFVLRGRCRDCGSAIPVRYPLVELASGALWLLAWALFGASWRTLFAIAFFYLLLILAAIDLDTFRLPNRLVALLAVLGGAGVLLSKATGLELVPLIGRGDPLLMALGGAVASAGLALGIALAYAGVRKREGFGMGDVKLLAAIGVFLGLYGVMVLFIASVLGAVVGVVHGVRCERGLLAKLPFGPYLALGAVIVTAAGPALWSWYAGLMG